MSANTFKAVNSFSDQAPHHRIRAKTIFSAESLVAVKNRTILEIGPHDGWFSRAMLDLGAAKVHAVEFDSAVVERLNRCFAPEIASGRMIVTNADIHHELFRLSPGSCDTIVCAGFLYHTPHFFWILEGMAYLDPEHIFVETSVVDWQAQDEVEFARLLCSEEINSPGERQTGRPAVPYKFATTRDTLLRSFELLGYVPMHEVNKKKVTLSRLRSSAIKHYMHHWKNHQYSVWLKRKALAQRPNSVRRRMISD